MTISPVDILILSNGPGEIATWVRPVVRVLREQLGDERSQLRISVVLSPCSNATGKEAALVRSYPEVDRVQPPEHFFPFLLWGKTHENWDWRKSGAVIFLGGDQAFAAIIGKRLGYRTVVYAEWEVRWYRWIDCFCVRQPSMLSQVPPQYRHKLTVVGDLMADVVEGVEGRRQKSEVNIFPVPPSPCLPLPLSPPPLTIGLLPGSKAAKLSQGVPLCLAIAQQIYAQRPQTRFILPVAPTLDLPTLATYADPSSNPILNKLGGVSAQLLMPSPDLSENPVLKTSAGVQIELIAQFPAHEFLCQCCLVLTTVGANTAELGALGIPMFVLLPTQQLDAMRSWDGIPGILANLPLLGSAFAKAINWLVLKQGRLFAWPNKWAGEEIVPELVGELQAAEVARLVLDYLDNPERLEQMRDRLLMVRGQLGASRRISTLVARILNC
ncbi:lipid-A-disaccharide synthase [Hydrococcus rivularis]|uniref:lipid-A-disaccharide synthase n=1 Tax=Hydrococcus rivularis TaxID=1616834 RepID=UPI000A4DFF46|nr:lipid-A-disaccharide synthase [Hydrococcus rivularis]